MSEGGQAVCEACDLTANPAWRRRFIFLAFLPLGYIAVSALYLLARWDQIPDRIPVHYGMFSNHVNAWADKGFGGVYALLIVGLVLTAALLIPVFFFILNHPFKPVDPRDDSPVDRARAKLQAIMFMLGAMHWVALVMCHASVAAALSPHVMLKASDRFLGMLVTAALPALFFVPLYYWLRPGQPSYADAGAQQRDRAQDFMKHWKLGVFYWNPADPSTIVPKRFGTGYTFNFASRLAWVYLGFIFFPLLCVLTILVAFSCR